MAVNLQINVDPSGAEEGFKKVGLAAEEAADAAEKAAEKSGQAAIKSLDQQIKRVRELNQDVKQPEALALELMDQKGLLKVEELKLQAQHMVLRNRHEQIAATRSLASYDREAAKEAEKAIAKVREEARATVVERMSKEHERARAEMETAEEKAQLDKDFEKDLQKLIDETAGKVTENFKRYRKSNEEGQKLLDRLKQAEEKLESHREKMHDDELARIKETEQKEAEARQRKKDSEIELQQGILKAEEEAEKKKADVRKGSTGVQDLAAQLQGGTGSNDRRLFESFIKDRMEEARKKAAAEGLTHSQTQALVTSKRREASKDFKDYQAGRGKFDLTNSNAKDGVEDENEKAVRETGNDIGRTRDNIVTENTEAANEVLSRQRGLTSQQITAAKEGLKIAEQIAREQAQQAAEIEEIRLWQQSVSTMSRANEESGRRRRAQRNSS